MLKIGIVGLAQVGKTTLFRIVTHARGSGLASGKPAAHLGVVRVPDPRLDRLAEVFHRPAVHASVEYVDTAGSIVDLARVGAQTATLREMDALAHVVRAFEDEALPPAGGGLGPRRDVESVELELILSDLAVVEKRLEKLAKDLAKQKSAALEKEQHVLTALKAPLEKQTPLREAALGPEDQQVVRGFTFLSLKPMLHILNLGEADAARADAAGELASELGVAERPSTRVAAVCGKVEGELAEMSDADAGEFLASYGLKESAIDRLIRACYELLGLISFLTIGDQECRAWTIRAGTTALEAAGQVHSAIARGFIRAEVVRFEKLAAAGSLAEARHRGVLRLEGKQYVVHDGDVIYFRHSA